MVFIFVILSIVIIYISWNVLYIFVFAVAGVFRKKKRYREVEHKNAIAVLIPAYAEDGVILETARMAASHDYPQDKFEVFIIADKLKPGTIQRLLTLKVTVIPVHFEKSTKARSLRYALQHIPEGRFDIALILDADNVMDNGCLEKVNTCFVEGFRMVQLHRCAKNMNTPTAVLDAISEEYNNQIFRQGHRALGLSSATIGSGMAFDYREYKSIMMTMDKLKYSGDDREVTLRMLEKGYVCEYIETGHVFDEKVQSANILEPQRARWMSAQLRYVHQFWIKNPRKTFSNGIHYFDFAIQTLTVPRVLLLFILVAMVCVSWIISFIPGMNIHSVQYLCSGLLLIYIFSLFVSIYGKIPMAKVLSASFRLPAVFLSVFRGMLKSKPYREGFVRTPKEFSGDS